MFNLGPMELAIVGVVAILLFGKRLPEVMRSLGKSYSEFRKGLTDIQSTITYSDYSSPSYGRASPPTDHHEDYDEPTAPKFEPPPMPSETAAVPSGEIDKPIGEKS